MPAMHYATLGRTGLEVSVAGLGCGGFSRLGLGKGGTEAGAVAVVHAALDAGVNILDTAAAYGTEEVVGKALEGRRDTVVISTKASAMRGDEIVPAAQVVESLDASLARLRTEHVEVFHLHAVPPAAFDRILAEVVPALEREREAGKIGHLGITERAPRDPRHEMLPRAIASGRFDVVMVAFHMLHQGARGQVFAPASAAGVGTLVMFAVRLLFSEPERLARTLDALAAEGRIDAAIAARADPLGFLVNEGGARDVMDAAYRFCRHEPGADVVLLGTGSVEHLRTNLASILAPPLTGDAVQTLRSIFGALEGVGLDAPGGARG